MCFPIVYLVHVLILLSACFTCPLNQIAYPYIESYMLFSEYRIWGDQGQAALEKASICLLNCGPTGTEALKNLVLGGIGSVTVVDGSKVEASDLGNNFLCNFCAMCFYMIHPLEIDGTHIPEY